MIEWYYRDRLSCEVGPLTAAEFQVCVAVGEIAPETEVWRSGLPQWTTYEELLSERSAAELISHSRRSARAPWSSSYRTMIALGLSAENRRPARSQWITSGCTPCGVSAPLWKDPLPEAKADPILDRKGADLIWLGRQFVRIALAGSAFVLVHYFTIAGP